MIPKPTFLLLLSSVESPHRERPCVKASLLAASWPPPTLLPTPYSLFDSPIRALRHLVEETATNKAYPLIRLSASSFFLLIPPFPFFDPWRSSSLGPLPEVCRDQSRTGSLKLPETSVNGTRLLENGLAEETECGYRSPLQHLQNVNATGIVSEKADCTSCLLQTESIFFLDAKRRFSD